jgi:hypothetical protein
VLFRRSKADISSSSKEFGPPRVANG